MSDMSDEVKREMVISVLLFGLDVLLHEMYDKNN